jgi:endothelin-converting enzyme/putative endopeptidase
LPYSPSLDLTSLDKSVDPCVDLYQYSCGGWEKKNPIPADQTRWDVYGKLYQDNLDLLRRILESAATAPKRDSLTRQIGDFYAACMDEGAADKRGLTALRPELEAIAAVKTTRQLAPLMARLQLMTSGAPILFGTDSTPDPDDVEHQIAELGQGGLGLPDRDYYTNTDAKSEEIRERYLQHVAKVFELLGASPAEARESSGAVMEIETALAKASLTRVERRDPYKQKNKMTLAQVSVLAPHFDWSKFFHALRSPAFQIVNVQAPAFFKEADAQLSRQPLKNWKRYLRYHLANAYAPYLSAAWVQENFDFYRRYLGGAKELQPRWKRCVQYANNQLTEAVGRVYVDRVFSPELKDRTLAISKAIERVLDGRIGGLDWMSAKTKQRALEKLHAIRNKIGYPSRWRDYSSVEIVPNDFPRNMRNTTVFEFHRRLDKIGQPLDRDEWFLGPQVVNAGYNPQFNDVTFTAAILQPPLYDSRMDDAPNYGNTGGTIGHELTHGFDDEGSQFDAKGNLANWWTAEDAKEFAQRTKCVEDQYSGYLAVGDIYVNGKLTLGESVADLGGEILAYVAWKDEIKNKKLEPVDGLTPDQRFFVGFAQWACSNATLEQRRQWALTDPHPPARYRINGVVVNMPEFAKAFSCKAGQPMVKPTDQVCRVW